MSEFLGDIQNVRGNKIRNITNLWRIREGEKRIWEEHPNPSAGLRVLNVENEGNSKDLEDVTLAEKNGDMYMAKNGITDVPITKETE